MDVKPDSNRELVDRCCVKRREFLYKNSSQLQPVPSEKFLDTTVIVVCSTANRVVPPGKNDRNSRYICPIKPKYHLDAQHMHARSLLRQFDKKPSRQSYRRSYLKHKSASPGGGQQHLERHCAMTRQWVEEIVGKSIDFLIEVIDIGHVCRCRDPIGEQ